MWRIVLTKQARKDAAKLVSAGPAGKAQALIEILRNNPNQIPPRYEKLVGDLAGLYSRRINIQHRLVYEILDAERTVKIIRIVGSLRITPSATPARPRNQPRPRGFHEKRDPRLPAPCRDARRRPR